MAPWIHFVKQTHHPNVVCASDSAEHELQLSTAIKLYTTNRLGVGPKLAVRPIGSKSSHDHLAIPPLPRIDHRTVGPIYMLRSTRKFEAHLYSLEKLKGYERVKVEYKASNNEEMYIAPAKPSQDKGIKCDPYLFEAIENCKNKNPNVKYFVIYFIIYFARGKSSHANVLLYDYADRSVTRYEPHGSRDTIKWNKEVDAQLRTWVRKNSSLFTTYHPPSSYCPLVGPQSLEHLQTSLATVVGNVFGKTVRMEVGGFCSIFAVLFLHYRLDHPELTMEELMEKMLKTPDELAVEVRVYAQHILNFAKNVNN